MMYMKQIILFLLMLSACGEAYERPEWVITFESEERRELVDTDHMDYLARSLAESLYLWGGYDQEVTLEAIFRREVVFVDFPFNRSIMCEDRIAVCRDEPGDFNLDPGDLYGLYSPSRVTVVAVLWPNPCLGASSLAHEWLHVALRAHGEREYSSDHVPESLWENVVNLDVNANFQEVFCEST